MATTRARPDLTPLDCEIRPATVRDVSEIVALWGELARLHAGLDPAFAPSAQWQDEYRYFLRSLLGRDDALAVVAVREARLIGYAVGRLTVLPGFFEERRRGYIHDVVTRHAYRRRGVGRRLVQALLDWMAEAGVPTVELTVAVGNDEAMAFWERMGFSPYMLHYKRDLR
ncbi:MAG: GNAT family N-acetyltransferase [Armatimonadota bacterium]|nr:GNAT family N-acetyltransferase [Armatimonadota bacterium]MDR7486389.1 GNAT family N-acetyltransferase [Armatimonadota bacterium]MDR7532127.1 GNAT family N-acetyltransferase [Armatimonadota bacterium]MDR7536717.1 GNAT family N-acetyltransferase [Armatimonadota bacterium]